MGNNKAQGHNRLHTFPPTFTQFKLWPPGLTPWRFIQHFSLFCPLLTKSFPSKYHWTFPPILTITLVISCWVSNHASSWGKGNRRESSRENACFTWNQILGQGGTSGLGLSGLDSHTSQAHTWPPSQTTLHSPTPSEVSIRYKTVFFSSQYLPLGEIILFSLSAHTL